MERITNKSILSLITEKGTDLFSSTQIEIYKFEDDSIVDKPINWNI